MSRQPTLNSIRVKMGNLIFKILLFTSLAFFFSACKEENLKTAIKQYKDRDFKNALFNFEKACLQGQIYACKMTASMYLHAKGTEASKAKSLKALEYACQWGDTLSCKITYKTYKALSLHQIANQMLQHGCQGGDSTLCVQLAINAYKNNDIKASLELANKACYGGNLQGCNLYLVLIEKHQKDPQKIKLIEKQIQKLNSKNQSS